MRRKLLLVVAALIALTALAGFVVYGGGSHEGPGQITPTASPPAVVEQRIARQPSAADGGGHILFGDLHVHTTFSADAFMRSLPMAGGSGAHPPADACDFARYCSALDFFAITDHAESLTQRHWDETVASVRQCEAVSAGSDQPDLIAFAGWEWSQVGLTADTHWGHRNVILRDLEPDAIPTRPIAATGPLAAVTRNTGLSALQQASIPVRDFAQRERYLDFRVFQAELAERTMCAEGVHVRELPDDCLEMADTPGELFRKLDEWGHAALVIPHGTTWGFYTPPGYVFDKALADANFDRSREPLIEVYSGHGNSEEFRSWRPVDSDAAGDAECPEPTDDYEPCCWRAGELIRARCGDAPADECDRRVAEARANYLAAGAAGHNTVPGATLTDWGACGQCTDCFNPAFNYQPGGSVQYALARGNFDDPNDPNHARYGFIASSDNHSARPGTGYREFARHEMTEAAGPRAESWRDFVMGPPLEASAESVPLGVTERDEIAAFRLVHLERQASFFMTGGLVAVHAESRSRGAIWDALSSRQVYGTSGDRILLWFDLVNAPSGPAPMGSEVAMAQVPQFEVRALGAHEQAPGCPEWVAEVLGAERQARLCIDECYNPIDRRRAITRVEVVRIRPQASDDEPIESLIDDPWRVIPCPDRADECRVTFSDPEFPAMARPAYYYVRAIQEPTPAVNAGGLRCDGDDCDPCYGDYRLPRSDSCLSENEERAWSSPIFLDPPL